MTGIDYLVRGNPVDMPDPIHIPIRMGTEKLAGSGPDDSCTSACFGTGPGWSKPDSRPEPNRIRAGFAQYDPGPLWKNATESQSRKLVADWLNSANSGVGGGGWGWRL